MAKVKERAAVVETKKAYLAGPELKQPQPVRSETPSEGARRILGDPRLGVQV
jgi:hypothetical protein